MRGRGTPEVRIRTAVCLWDFCSLLKWIFVLRTQGLCTIKHTGLGDSIVSWWDLGSFGCGSLHVSRLDEASQRTIMLGTC